MKHKYKDTGLGWSLKLSSTIEKESDRVFKFTSIRPQGTSSLIVGHWHAHTGVHPTLKDIPMTYIRRGGIRYI